jgi:predicted DNA-binding protein
MAPTRTPNTVQLTVRLEHTANQRLEVLTDRLSRPGLPVAKTDVLRMAIGYGLDRLEEEYAEPKRRK